MHVINWIITDGTIVATGQPLTENLGIKTQQVGDCYVVKTGLPGYGKKDLKITREKNWFKISSTKEEEEKTLKVFSVPSRYDLEPTTVLKNGLMTFTFDLKESEKPQEILIS